MTSLPGKFADFSYMLTWRFLWIAYVALRWLGLTEYLRRRVPKRSVTCVFECIVDCDLAGLKRVVSKNPEIICSCTLIGSSFYTPLELAESLGRVDMVGILIDVEARSRK